MSISLKSNWTNNHKINRVYSVKMKNQKLINEIFDKFHEQKKMKWFSRFIFFEYSVFVIWKTMMKNDKSEKKTRDSKYSWIESNNANRRIFHVVSNWHNNNHDWMQSHFNCRCSEIFLSVNRQKKNRYKQTIITHRNQKQFNVTVMKFKNSSAYVQKQIDFMLKNFYDFVKIYINDIVFFSTFLNQHIEHLNKDF